jgi:hypothetical protein
MYVVRPLPRHVSAVRLCLDVYPAYPSNHLLPHSSPPDRSLNRVTDLSIYRTASRYRIRLNFPPLSDSCVTSRLYTVYVLATLLSTLTDVCVSSPSFTAYLAESSWLSGSSRLSGSTLTPPLFAIIIRRSHIPLCLIYPPLLASDYISLIAGYVYLLGL